MELTLILMKNSKSINRINKLEAINKINLAGKEQHGFTKGKSTATAGLVLQSLIAGALDDDHLALLASIDLSKQILLRWE